MDLPPRLMTRPPAITRSPLGTTSVGRNVQPPRFTGGMAMRRTVWLAVVFAALTAPWGRDVSGGHDEKGSGKAAIHAPSSLQWKDGPPSLPKGAKIAVLEGDPAKEGPFVFRVK